jgi:hypothetical protein
MNKAQKTVVVTLFVVVAVVAVALVAVGGVENIEKTVDLFIYGLGF